MLHANLVISADDAAFEEAPNALDAVRVNIPANPLFFRMIDALMASIRVANSFVSRKLVSVDRLRLRICVVCDELVKRGLVSVGDDLKANLAFALHGSYRDGLVSPIATAHAASLPTDVGLVHFHNAAQKLAVGVPHGSADAVAQVPSGLIGDVQGALHLESADTLLALRHEIDSEEPLGERQMRVVEDCAGRNRKMVVAPVAVKLLAGRDFRDERTTATRAANASGPAERGKPFAALVVIAVLLDQLHQVDFSLNRRNSLAGFA